MNEITPKPVVKQCGRCAFAFPHPGGDIRIKLCHGNPPMPFPSGQMTPNGPSETIALRPWVHIGMPACHLWEDKFPGLPGGEGEQSFEPRSTEKLAS
jgi:hypothetical protein